MSIANILHLNAAQQTNLATIEKAWQQYGDGDMRKYAYIIATAWHECRLKPISEYPTDTNIYKDYWKTGYKGRGFVQLTHRANYVNAGNKIGVNLVNHPERALEPTIAARILVQGLLDGWFTGRKLSDYINSSHVDYKNARRVVNGIDKAQLFANTATQIYNTLKTTPKTAKKPKTLWLWLAGIAGGLLFIGGICYAAIYFSNKKRV